MLELRVGLPRVPWPRCCSRESPPAPPGALPGLAPPLLADSTSATRSSISSPMNVPDARGATAFLGDACYEHFPLPVPSQGEGAFYNQFSMEEALHRNLAGRMLRMNRSDVVLLDSPWRPWITCCQKTWNMCGSRSQITNPGGNNYWRDTMAAFCSGEWCPTMVVIMGVTFFQRATFKPWRHGGASAADALALSAQCDHVCLRRFTRYFTYLSKKHELALRPLA